MQSVLAIDDDEAILKAIERILRQDYDVTVCSSSEAAVDLVAGGARYDVILCDIAMPHVDGFDVLAAVQRQAAHAPERFVFLTGGPRVVETERELLASKQPFVMKPFRIRELREAVRSCLLEA